MWLSRAKYEQVTVTLAHLRAEVQSKQSQIERVQKEIDYWREKFEESLRRADRIHDNAMVSGGLPPVSDLGYVSAEKKHAESLKAMLAAEKENIEMFGEEIRGDGVAEVVEEDFEIDGGLAEAVLGALRE